MEVKQPFLPVSREDMERRGWDRLDFLLVSGDAYVDHPSFGPAIIGRMLEEQGFRVGILAQPDWRSTAAFKVFGKPRLGVLVTAGNLDSMLNRYTAAKRRRSEDSFAPGGRAGLRPERATIVYANRIREAWKNIPLIIGGIEASLRRFTHYDYWSDSLRRSILVDSRADLLVFGMGEKPVTEIAAQLVTGVPVQDIRQVAGTCFLTESPDELWDYVEIPGYEAVSTDKAAFAEAFRLQYREQDPIRGKRLVQRHGDLLLVQNPPSKPLSTTEMDQIYALPYQRTYHPAYDAQGGVPAIQEVKFSLVSHRGCFGNCSFCALYAHQGRMIQHRSQDSLLEEAAALAKLPDFKGYIHDVGGPTANFRHIACEQQRQRGTCADRQCLFPEPCKNLDGDHQEYLALLRKLRNIPGVKKVFIRSGIRFDYLLAPGKWAAGNQEFLRELCMYHVSGQLKVAPEHVAPAVTNMMGKSGKKVYLQFMKAFQRTNQEVGKEQYLVPYFMSSHPGSGLKEAIELAEFIRDLGYHPEQVQDFIPTPGSLSTCIYYTGIHPLTGKKVYVAKSPEEKKMQRALIQYRDPKNRPIVYEALTRAGRQDLIGYGPQCLLRPDPRLAASGRKGQSAESNHGARQAPTRRQALKERPTAGKPANRKKR
ncbi:MAG TPA: YgiQ family radical SAM protein [Patescibacteria group bacterium]|nr:YgiQ family radical SAM protein [Patescibacteria group bacterium]